MNKNRPILEALNPRHSVMVDACAGTGKTWLLVSRIIRLLLNGVPAKHILAITFTRKAAAEMQARLKEWCRDLAFKDDEWIKAFLLDRGVLESELNEFIPRAKRLYQDTVIDSPVTIQTFDEWFLSLIRFAPLSSGLPVDIVPGVDRLSLRQEAWQRFLSNQSVTNINSAFKRLVRQLGSEGLRQCLLDAANWRVEWQLLNQAQDPRGFWQELDYTQHQALNPESLNEDKELHSLAAQLIKFLSEGSAASKRQADELTEILKKTGDCLLELMGWTFTEDGFGNDKQTLYKALVKIGQETLWRTWVEIIERYREGYRLQQTAALNLDLYECLNTFLNELLLLKTKHREADFNDIAYWVYQLLCDPVESPHWMQRLDSRYQQVLIDEFQDTNPLQWHILRQWFLNAKESDSSLILFLVGDPKQAIYRFRRSDSRIFEEARSLLDSQYQAIHVTLNQSYRSYVNVINLVNHFFTQKPHFSQVTHLPKKGDETGYVQLWLSQKTNSDENNSNAPQLNTKQQLRNPLTQPRDETVEHSLEAVKFAKLLKDWVGSREIMTPDGKKLLRYKDILILARRRQTLLPIEEALRDELIPFVSQQKGQLLQFLEIEDLLAILKLLAYPMDNLSMAQVLKSPLVQCKDEDLLQFSVENDWWSQLDTVESLAQIAPLLKRWRHLSQTLPVHDLLETILIEGDLMSSYARCMTPERFYQAKANIHAFLEFSLSWNSGRYPNLIRFIDDMDELKQDEAQSPDQGVLASSVDAVRLMTIHGAKGLEAPMVWLIDNDTKRSSTQSLGWYVSWPPQQASPQHFMFVPEKRMIPKFQQEHLSHESDLLKKEEDHLLYVALTRAQSELHVLGNKGEGQSDWIDDLCAFAENYPQHLPLENLT